MMIKILKTLTKSIKIVACELILWSYGSRVKIKTVDVFPFSYVDRPFQNEEK